MINSSQRKAYTEVLTVLDEFNLTKELPNEILEFMCKEKDNDCKYEFNREQSFEKQIISKKGAELLSIIYLNYLCNDVDKKDQLKKIYEENELKNVSKNNLSEVLVKNKKLEGNAQEEKSLVVKKENKFEKIINWIIRFVKKK